MQTEIVVIGTFTLLAIGRIAWEKLNGRESETLDTEAHEWADAIK